MISNNNKIKRLSEQVANQIAAGEVIERPASVVKELMENSIDAGSDQITLKIKRSANSYLSITDNGSGISKEDLPLAISQHATSKLVTLHDLQFINSLGFRGEALASICSAAKVKITSKNKENEDTGAWAIEVAGDTTQYKLLPASHPIGTTIEIRDLFFNMPVRKRFLKAERTEYQHILEVFQKIALSNFACEFTLISDDRIVYKLPKALTRAAKDNRVKKIFSAGFINNADYFEGKAAGIKIYGWISNADYHRSQTDQQYFFLNNRSIRDKLILHALKSVYGQILPNGRHPCYVLYLELSQSEVDINVHPTKHEVRFCESRWVYQFIVQQLTNVLNKQDLSKKPVIPDEEPGFFRLDPGSTRFVLDRDDTSQTSCISPASSTHFTLAPKGTYRDDNSHISCISFVKEDKAESISNFGNIVADINNSFIITQYQKEHYLVDLNSAYSYLVYAELSKQWQSRQKLISVDSLIIERIFIEELYSLVLSCSSYNIANSQKSKDKFLQCLSNVIDEFTNFGFVVDLRYSKEHCGAEILNANTGELCNELLIMAIPRACRYSNIKDLFVLATSFLIVRSDELGLDTDDSSSLDVVTELRKKLYNQEEAFDRLFTEMSRLAMVRLARNLLRIEQNAILAKLAKIEYNNSQFKTSKLAKKLTEDGFAKLMNF